MIIRYLALNNKIKKEGGVKSRKYVLGTRMSNCSALYPSTNIVSNPDLAC